MLSYLASASTYAYILLKFLDVQEGRFFNHLNSLDITAARKSVPRLIINGDDQSNRRHSITRSPLHARGTDIRVSSADALYPVVVAKATMDVINDPSSIPERAKRTMKRPKTLFKIRHEKVNVLTKRYYKTIIFMTLLI